MASLGFTLDAGGPFRLDRSIPAIAGFAVARNWVGWRYEARGGEKLTKVPISPGGWPANVRKPSSWGSLDDAEARVEQDGLDGVGIVLTSELGLVGADLDEVIDEDGIIAPWARAILALGETYAEISPSGRGIRIIGIGSIDRARVGNGAEIYSDGRYLTITGNLLAGAPDDILPAPATIEALLIHIGGRAPAPARVGPAPQLRRTEHLVSSSVDISYPRLAAYVDRALRSEIDELSSASAGGRNHRLNIASLNLHSMVAAGWLSQAEVEVALVQAAEACGLVHDDGMRQVMATIRSGARKGLSEPRAVPADIRDDAALAAEGEAIARRLTREADGTMIDAETGEIVEEELPAPAAPEQSIGVFPDRLTRVPGLVGQLVDWITATSRRPSRVLALGAAITLVGTAMGRHYAGPTGSSTVLYMLTLAPTGAGKDHALQQIKRVLSAARLADCIGPDEFVSMPAVINFLLRSPLSLCPMDEFGAFLRRVNHRKASGFERSITKTLRSVWGTNFGQLTTPEWAGRSRELVSTPHMSIYGVSTPEEFFEALDGGDLDNGFLNRFTLLTVATRPADVDPELSPTEVPDLLAERLGLLLGGGNPLVAATRTKSSQASIDPVTIPWADDDARQVFDGLKAEVEAAMDIGPSTRSFMARTAEMAVRMATILAAGRNAIAPMVTADDMAWGREVALWSARTMMRDARLYMAETEAQAEANRILRLVQAAPGGRITQRNLRRRLAHRMKTRDLADVIKSLTESGAMIEERVTPVGGGTPSIWYRIGEE